MSFTWIPLYEDLATRIIDYEKRQPELLAFLRELKAEGLLMVRLVEDDERTPLTDIDPFTFFAVFNRGVTDENRKAILVRMREFFGSAAALPDDFDGIPLADNKQSWFFPWAKARKADDIPSLWALARQAVTGGREAVTAATFNRCLAVQSVKIAKLSMGLFWLRPQAFTPLDGRSQQYLRRHEVQVPKKVATWDEYRDVVEATIARLGDNFPALSRAAYVQPDEKRRYWAGGHLFGKTSKLAEFLEQRTWYIGWKKDDVTKASKAAWKRFRRIKPGDLFAIKGLGGRNYTLKVHAVGQVDEVDVDAGRISWTDLELPLFNGRAPPKPGDGTWFETLCEVTVPDARLAIFPAGELTPRVANEPTMKTPPVKPTSVVPSRPTYPLNLIFHGPPGTGKTWTMRQMREAFALRKDSLPRPVWPDVADLTWFEVVALALHDLGAPTEAPGIAAHPLVQAKYVERAPQAKLGPYVWGQLQSHAVKASKTVKYAQRSGHLIFDKQEDGRWFLPEGLPEEVSAKAGLAAALAPGTEASPDNQFLVTFHPSFTYEDFVEGIRPESGETGDETVRYPLHPGIFKQACERAVQLAGFAGGLDAFCKLPAEERRKKLATASPAVLFIDEINRGNVARIFGELITLIEPDKRLGGDEELIVTLPGSRARFGVPSNLWIIGTMNTADRSVVALDVALRRRFAFHECPPDPTLLDGISIEGIELGKLLKAINKRLLVLRDRDHLIGHAFFWPMKTDSTRRTLDEVRRVFRDSIVPLLLEYFHDDLGRIGLVVGKAFVNRDTTATQFADFDHDQKEDLAERPVWTLADPMNLPAEAFRKVYA